MTVFWRCMAGILILATVLGPAAESQQKRNGKRRKAKNAANQGVNAVANRTANQVNQSKGGKRANAGAKKSQSKAAAAQARRPLREVTRTPIRGSQAGRGTGGKLQEKLAGQQGVRYQINGGVVGLDLELVILPDGRAFLRDHGEVTREASFGKKGFTKLQNKIKEAGVEDARAQYGERDASGRRTLKTLILNRGTKTIKVSSYDDPLDPAPDGIRQSFELLDRLLSSPRLKRRQRAAEEFVTVDGLSMTVQVNQHVFSLPGMDDLLQEPEILEVTLALVNAAAQPLQLYFPSEKRFDFSIRDSQNNLMRRWSDGRSFSQVPQSTTIGGENRLLFVGRLPLTNRDDELLRAGVYNLEYEVYSRGSSLSFVSDEDPEAEETGARFLRGSLGFRIQTAEEAGGAARATKSENRARQGQKGGRAGGARGQGKGKNRGGNRRAGANQGNGRNQKAGAARARGGNRRAAAGGANRGGQGNRGNQRRRQQSD